jgi:hypothetical protein
MFIFRPFFLQHFVFVSVYHILQLCIFHDANVIIPSNDLGIYFLCYTCGNEHIATHDTIWDIIVIIALENGAHV